MKRPAIFWFAVASALIGHKFGGESQRGEKIGHPLGDRCIQLFAAPGLQKERERV